MLMITIQRFAIQRRTNHARVVGEGRHRINHGDAVTSLLFLLTGFLIMMVMRYQLAYPMTPVPVVGAWLGEAQAASGILLPEFYNQLGAMHGTIMIFLGVVPLAVGGFGVYLVPLQIGAPEMAFPRLGRLG